MRKHLLQDFTRIYHVDLHGNVRKNPKLSGTTHNVFGIQVGVGITLAVRCKGEKRLRYHRVPETWRKEEKLAWLDERKVPWQVARTRTPDHTWLVPQNADQFARFLPIDGDLRPALHRRATQPRRLWSTTSTASRSSTRVKQFIEDYNAEVDRYRRSGRDREHRRLRPLRPRSSGAET